MNFVKATYPYFIQTWLLVAFLFGFSGYNAQTYFSVKENYLRNKPSSAAVNADFVNAYPDTTVSNFAFTAARNFGGNLGLASAPYFFQRRTEEPGFIFFRPFFSNDRIHSADVKYYRSEGPFAELIGIAGTGKFQMFKLLFSHTPAGKMNFTLRLNQYTSGGFYKRQESRITNLYLSSNAQSKNQRTGYYFYVLHNSVSNLENGGIRDTLLNARTALQTKSLLSVRLTAADRSNKQSRVEFQPYWRLQKSKDSLSPVEQILSLQSSFDDQSYRYRDQAIARDGFYTNRFRDSLSTLDSAHVRQFRNGLSYHLSDRYKRWGLELAYRNEITQVWQWTDDLMINDIVKTHVFFNPGLKDSMQRLSLQAKASQVLRGYNAGDVMYQAEGDWNINVKRGTRFFVAGSFENRRPDQQFLKWQSNHFRWEEGFAQQQKTELELILQVRNFLRVNFLRQNIHNLLYFNEQALPKQLQGTAKNTAIAVSVAKVLFRHLGLFAEHRIQQSTAATVLRFPSQITTARLFYTGNLSKNKLQLNFGTQLQLYQNFSPYSYMPATQVFYLQSTVNTGVFPYLDVYLSGRIRPVSFFVKLENILANVVGYNYFLQTAAFQPASALRFGISWMFFD